MSDTPRVDSIDGARVAQGTPQYHAMLDLARALEREYTRLQRAATAIYEAGHWTCDRPVDAAALWTELRDAMGRAPGNAPKPL